MAQDGVDVGSRPFEEIKEGSAGEVLLLEMQVQFSGNVLVVWLVILEQIG